MNKHEKIEVMFEAILTEVEKINGKLESATLTASSPKGEDNNDKADQLIAAMLNLRIPVCKYSGSMVLNKLKDLKGQMKSMKDTVQPVRSGRSMLWLYIIFVLSVILNIYFLFML